MTESFSAERIVAAGIKAMLHRVKDEEFGRKSQSCGRHLAESRECEPAAALKRSLKGENRLWREPSNFVLKKNE